MRKAKAIKPRLFKILMSSSDLLQRAVIVLEARKYILQQITLTCNQNTLTHQYK
jgi:hypothetical protein